VKTNEWKGYCEKAFKDLFYPKCVVSNIPIKGDANFFQVPEGRLLEVNYVAYKLKTVDSKLVCRLPGPANQEAAGEGFIPLVVKVPNDKVSLQKLRNFVDSL